MLPDSTSTMWTLYCHPVRLSHRHRPNLCLKQTLQAAAVRHPQQPASYMSNPPPSPPPRRRLRQRSWEPLRAVAAAAAAAATTAITIVALISSLSVLPTVNSAPNLRQDMKAAATDSPPSNNSTIITTASPTCRARAFNDLGDSASNLTPAEIFALEPPVFPSDFVWGVATSAYQIEGAVKEDGRGASIWDIFAHTPGKISGDTTGDVACDHYHRYEEDIALMRSLGVSHYRFSISWSRILPTGTDEQINDRGIAFYNNLINALLEAGIQPAVTLYHWDLPQTLQEQGGWQNSSLIVPAFAKYADLCFYTFGDRVKMWFTINEPWSTAVLGHGIGVMAPGIKDQEWAVYLVGHTQLLAHAAAVKVYRDKHQDKQRGKIGIVLSTQFKEPLCDTSPSDIEAAERNLQFYLGWFASPIFNGDYPAVMRERVGKRLPSFSGEEMKEVKGSVDFLGINTYGSSMITDRGGKRGGYFADVSTASTGDPAWSQGESSWLWIAPAGMRKLLRWVKVEYDSPVVYVTENGLDVAGEEQWGEGGQGGGFRKDAARVDYIKNYLAEVGKARKFDGVDVRGYFVWSLLDNFEWAEGFSSRFGLVRVMFKEGQKRVPKDSFFSYQELIRRFMDSDGKMSVGGGEGANTDAAPLPPALVAKVPPPAIAASPAFTIAPAGDPGAMLSEAELP